ncbi:hypothetical protein PYCC9005_004278 [Savitreella phatthalungensis]
MSRRRYFPGQQLVAVDDTSASDTDDPQEPVPRPPELRHTETTSLPVDPVPAPPTRGILSAEQRKQLPRKAAATTDDGVDEEDEEDDGVSEVSEDDDSDDDESEEEEEAEEDDEHERRRKALLSRPVFKRKFEADSGDAQDGHDGTGQIVSNGLSSSSYDDAGVIDKHTYLESFIRHERAVRASAATFSGLASSVDDTDGLDPEGEYEGWKLRELLRIKRERDRLAAREEEREAIERRRAMPEEERLAEETAEAAKQRDEKIAARKEQAGEGFLQKYHHRGAFFQDDGGGKDGGRAGFVEGEIRNKSWLPKSLQRRSINDIGKRGATRWTHLANEDTSRDSMFSGPTRQRTRDDQ